MGRKLSEADKKYLMSLKPSDITFDLLIDLFADKSKKVNGKITITGSKIKTSDEFTLKKGEYTNSTDVLTNAGLFIFNKLIVEEHLVPVLGYVNEPLTNGVVNKLEDKLSKALLTDKITVDQMVQYLNRLQWYGFQMNSVVCGSFTMKTIKPSSKAITARNKLFKENAAKIKDGDVVTAVKIEKEVVGIAHEELKNDPGMDLYKSGARGSFDNTYKNISLMKGPVYNPATGKFDIVESNFMEGIQKKDIHVHGNSVITGAYPKAIGTAVSGYFSKQIIAAMQAVVLDKRGSDCGSKGYLNVVLNEKNKDDFLYRYIIEGSKLVLLDDDNMSKYLNKPLKMRSPMYCIGKKLCRTCAGTMYDKLDIDNIGLTAARVSSTLLNMSMKKFHNSTSKIIEIDINTLVLE